MELLLILLIVGVVIALVRRAMAASRAADRRGNDDAAADASVPHRTEGRRSAPPAPTFNAPVPTFDVVAVGTSGSGKTVLLSSMFHELSYFTDARSYMLDVNPQDRLLLNNLYEEVSDPSRPWPRATARGETKDFQFRCVGRDREGRTHTVLQINYLDFAGVLLEDATHSASAAFDRLHKSIKTASALLVLVDGRRVRQLLAGEPGGREYLALTMQSVLGFAQQVDCPLHFVVTKWDLIQDFEPLRHIDESARLDRVVDALLQQPHINSLVHVHSARQIVRIIPVSAVGPGFTDIGRDGRVVKKSTGRLAPTNVETPLSAVVPDLFGQVEGSLDAQTRKAMTDHLHGRLHRGTGQFLAGFGAFLDGPAGSAVRAALHATIGPNPADAVFSLFLDFAARGSRQTAAGGAASAKVEQEIVAVRAVRAKILDDFVRAIHYLEFRYPRSILKGREFTAAR